MCASLLDREYSLITEGGGCQWVCCLAPVKVVSKEANNLIKLYSQYATPGTLCNLLFNTPPPLRSLSHPPCLTEVLVFVAV